MTTHHATVERQARAARARRRGRARALLGVLLALALVVALAAPLLASATAHAAVGTAPLAVDPNARGSLTLHKMETPYWNPVTCPANGASLPTECAGDASPVAGVTFTVTQVEGVDVLGGSAGDKIAAYEASPSSAAAHLDRTTARTGTTAADGSLAFSDLPLGLYYVEETSTPAGVTPSLPFVVSVPGYPAEGAALQYDIDVYPKNAVDSISIEVVDDGVVTEQQPNHAAVASRRIRYLIRSTITPSLLGRDADGKLIPQTADGIGTYTVSDDLDPRLSYLGAVVSVVDADGTVLASLSAAAADSTEGDYLIWATGTDGVRRRVSAAEAAGISGGPLIEIEMTASGLAKLAAAKNAHPDAVVLTDLRTRADSYVGTGLTSGVIKNTASFVPNARYAETHGTSDPLEATTVETHLGDLIIKKVSIDGTRLLPGAAFAVYRGTTGVPLAQACGSDALTEERRVGTMTSDDTGVAALRGIQVSDYVDGAVVSGSSMRHYCLVETDAPAGYRLLPDPVPFDLTTVGAATDLNGAVAALTLDDPATGNARLVADPKASVPDKIIDQGKKATHKVVEVVTRPLPQPVRKAALAHTGASITVGLLAIALVALGVWLLARRRRRDEDESVGESAATGAGSGADGAGTDRTETPDGD